MTQATRSSSVRSTQLCDRNVAVSVAHSSSTEGFPNTRMKPTPKAVRGCSFCSITSAPCECDGIDLAEKYFHERQRRNKKLNSSMIDFTTGKARKAAKPASAIPQ